GPPADRPADRLGADPGRRLHAPRVPADAAQRARGGRLQPRRPEARARGGRVAAVSRRQTGVLKTVLVPTLAGLVLALAFTLPLAWKWELGVRRVAISVTALALL